MRSLQAIALVITQLLIQSAYAALPAPVLAALKAENVPIDSVSIYVQQVDKAEPRLMYNADIARNPASVIKLMTSYAALDVLGPAYRWKTNFYAIEAIENGMLQGGLWVKASGDPSLNTGNIAEIASAIHQRYGLQKICCGLMVDNSVFAPVAFDTNVFDSEPYRSYNAPAEALMLNQQAVRFQFILPENPQKNNRVLTVAYPNWPGLNVQSDIKVSGADCNEWKSQLIFKRVADQFFISGNYPAACNDKYIDLHWMSGSEYFSSFFYSAWQSAGGSWIEKNSKPISPKMRFAPLPESATLLYQHTSPPLADVLRDMNKTSNNVIARAVYLALSETDNQPASVTRSEQVLRGWLASKQLNFNELVLENGSGLSRKERISAAHLGQLLISAYQSPIMPELTASLPILGVDGTLERRKDNSASGRAHLKSGSLDNVRAVAGYVLDNQSRRWVIVFIANGLKAANTKSAQQALLDWVVAQP